ncbi:MAG: cysteine desulfurase [Phycisphaerae bacterium]
MSDIIYLDNAATSWPKPACVQAEMARFLAEDAANPGRAGHRMAVAAERMLDDVRGKLARLFDAPDPHRVVFTLNCTDALNMAIKGVVREGDHVITSTLEHNSVSRPLQALFDAKCIGLTRVPMTEGGFIDPLAVEAAITPRTRLIAVTHCSNVLGTIQPAEDIGRIARAHDLLFLLDAAQSAGLVPISVRRMNIDLLAFPGHKSLLGPPGTGGLYVGERADPRPWREGGTGGDSSSPTQPHVYPYWLEGGTPNTPGIAGLGAAVDYVLAQDPARTLGHERAMAGRIIDALAGDDRFRLLGPSDDTLRTGVVSLNAEGLLPVELGTALDESFRIAVRPGLHCAPYIHRELGTFPDGAVRIAPGPFTSSDEIEKLIEALGRLIL